LQGVTRRIRLTSDAFKASAVFVMIAFTCFGAPQQESRQPKDAPKDNSRPPIASAVNEPAAPNQTALPNAAGPAVSTPTPDVNAKRPATGGPVSPGSAKPVKTADKATPDHGTPDDYKIGAGDVLHIGVFHEPDASVQSVVVRTDGRISMPLLKEVSVAGLTPGELEAKLTEGLSKFLPAPDVNVVITAINSKKIYIIGAVRHEGTLSLTYPMNVLQALAEAGGVSEYAKRRKIYVLRNKDGKEVRLPFDYDAALKGERMELNVPLIAGDTIVVPGGQ
jgi:polysaccharide biosynthesis/export protein